VPAGGVDRDEELMDAAIREVREETGVCIDTELTLLGTHEHLDGLGRPALSYFFRAAAPDGVPQSWQHIVSGDGDDAALVFNCRSIQRRTCGRFRRSSAPSGAQESESRTSGRAHIGS
jgi:8-oxo-dGTP pyrophosphatase MutT (NUDIX family)